MPVYMTISNTMTLMEDHHLTAELSRCISSNSLTDQVESTTTLRLLVSGMSSGSTVQKIIESGVIYTLINFLQSDDSQLQNEALFALCNIAAIMGAHTKTVVSAGGVGSLVALIRHSAHQELWYTAAWALSNIVTDSCAGRDLILSYDALTPLIRDDEDNAQNSSMFLPTDSLKCVKSEPSFPSGSSVMWSSSYSTSDLEFIDRSDFSISIEVSADQNPP
nr:uncharacterized protein LOC128701770 [Cherax quadricarinatus]